MTIRTLSDKKLLPLGVYALAASVFALGTSEYGIAGITSQIAGSFHVSISQVGLLITIFALGMMLGAPLVTLLTLNLSKKMVIIISGIVFCAVHILSTLVTDFSLFVVMRFLAALSCATELTAAAVLGVSMVDKAKEARALAVIIGGNTVANVLGIPIISFIGNHSNWKMALIFISLSGFLSLVIVIFSIPSQAHSVEKIALINLAKKELQALKNRNVIQSLALTAFYQATLMSVYSYIEPLLTNSSGLSGSWVPLVMFFFGVGTFLGINLGGRTAQKSPGKNILWSFVSVALVFLLQWIFHNNSLMMSIGVFLLGISAYSMVAALNLRVMNFAIGAPTLSVATNLTAFNIGGAIGPYLGGFIIDKTHNITNTLPLGLTLALAASLITYLSLRSESHNRINFSIKEFN